MLAHELLGHLPDSRLSIRLSVQLDAIRVCVAVKDLHYGLHERRKELTMLGGFGFGKPSVRELGGNEQGAGLWNGGETPVAVPERALEILQNRSAAHEAKNGPSVPVAQHLTELLVHGADLEAWSECPPRRHSIECFREILAEADLIG